MGDVAMSAPTVEEEEAAEATEAYCARHCAMQSFHLCGMQHLASLGRMDENVGALRGTSRHRGLQTPS